MTDAPSRKRRQDPGEMERRARTFAANREAAVARLARRVEPMFPPSVVAQVLNVPAKQVRLLIARGLLDAVRLPTPRGRGVLPRLMVRASALKRYQENLAAANEPLPQGAAPAADLEEPRKHRASANRGQDIV